jgi:hypothetical protein
MASTVTLKNGMQVLAKLYNDRLVAVTYCNMSQARRKAESLGCGWIVQQPNRVFFVVRSDNA